MREELCDSIDRLIARNDVAGERDWHPDVRSVGMKGIEQFKS